MAYPSTIDAPDTTMQGGSLLATNDHANDHRLLGSAAVNIENKLGVGAGSAAANQLLVGQGAGTSNWQSTWNGGTLGTVNVLNGTVSNGSLTVSGGTQGDVYYGTTNGQLTRLPAGTNGQFLQTGGISANPSWQSVMNFLSSGTQATGTTASATYVDLTGAAVTLNPGRTVNIMAIATGYWSNNASGASTNLRLLFNGTVVQDVSYRETTATHEKSFALSGAASFGTGLGTIKLQVAVPAANGTASYFGANVSTIWI